MSINKTKLPDSLNRVILFMGVLGMLIGLVVSLLNKNPVGWSLFVAAGMGLLFALSTKYFIVKWMFFFMETKLEIAAKEKEEARMIERAKREERQKKANEEAEKIKADEEALKQAANPKAVGAK
jgi:uncharacterized protein YacL